MKNDLNVSQANYFMNDISEKWQNEPHNNKKEKSTRDQVKLKYRNPPDESTYAHWQVHAKQTAQQEN